MWVNLIHYSLSQNFKGAAANPADAKKASVTSTRELRSQNREKVSAMTCLRKTHVAVCLYLSVHSFVLLAVP